MKKSAHLFYGIIIGILLFACLGSSIENQKKFKEIRVAAWSNLNGYVYMDGEGIKKIAEERPKLFQRRPDSAIDSIRANGWTIIQVYNDEEGVKILIGR